MDYPALLAVPVLLLGLNAFVNGWLFTLWRLDEFPHHQPRLYHILGPRGRTALWIGAVLGDFLAVILLFWIKWYAGLIGMAGAYAGPFLFSRVLCAIRRSVGIPSTPEEVADLVSRYPRMTHKRDDRKGDSR